MHGEIMRKSDLGIEIPFLCEIHFIKFKNMYLLYGNLQKGNSIRVKYFISRVDKMRRQFRKC